jgi:hypothetical protein
MDTENTNFHKAGEKTKAPAPHSVLPVVSFAKVGY